MPVRPIAVLCLALAGLAGCDMPATTPRPAAPAPAAVAGSYRLTTFDGAAPKGSVTMTLTADGALAGEGPCNAWNTRNTVAPPALRLAPIASTRRACLIEGGEGAFFAALQGADRMAAANGRLTLSGHGHTLVFQRL